MNPWVLARLYINAALFWEKDCWAFKTLYTLATAGSVYLLFRSDWNSWVNVTALCSVLEFCIPLTKNRFGVINWVSIPHALLFRELYTDGIGCQFNDGPMFMAWIGLNYLIHLVMFWYIASSHMQYLTRRPSGNTAKQPAA